MKGLLLAATPLVFLAIMTADVRASGWWKVQSVDTMKYSRDTARTKGSDKAFGQVIDTQIKNIAGIGATHVAIDTPYDEEFLPFLRRWVDAARKYRLKVWFRGNWSGWEGWFGYQRISREEHLAKTLDFINGNADLFADGDIFTPCPECENGGPGDPRQTGDRTGFTQFMVSEYRETGRAFARLGLSVATNFASMNGDVARLVMDKQTTAALGGLVVIDHYVKSPEELAADVKEIAETSGGRVALGEFGVPVPDITGSMSEDRQAEWLKSALSQLSRIQSLAGVNYWVNTGGTTQLWTATGSPLPAAEVLAGFYNPPRLSVTVKNQIGQIIPGVIISYRGRQFVTDGSGQAVIPANPDTRRIAVSAADYRPYDLLLGTDQKAAEAVLQKTHESLIFKIRKLIHRVQELL
jgi:hypothetical protein